MRQKVGMKIGKKPMWLSRGDWKLAFLTMNHLFAHQRMFHIYEGVKLTFRDEDKEADAESEERNVRKTFTITSKVLKRSKDGQSSQR